MRLQKVVPVLLAVALICLSKVEHANAYFTTYVTSIGGYTVRWGHHEKIEESFNDWSKYVSISSQEGSVPVFVRVRAFCGADCKLEYTGNDWTRSGDYYYYNKPLMGGEKTTALRIAIVDIPDNPKEDDNFNVVVIYETVPAQYSADGVMLEPIGADWDLEVEP